MERQRRDAVCQDPIPEAQGQGSQTRAPDKGSRQRARLQARAPCKQSQAARALSTYPSRGATSTLSSPVGGPTLCCIEAAQHRAGASVDDNADNDSKDDDSPLLCSSATDQRHPPPPVGPRPSRDAAASERDRPARLSLAPALHNGRPDGRRASCVRVCVCACARACACACACASCAEPAVSPVVCQSARPDLHHQTRHTSLTPPCVSNGRDKTGASLAPDPRQPTDRPAADARQQAGTAKLSCMSPDSPGDRPDYPLHQERSANLRPERIGPYSRTAPPLPGPSSLHRPSPARVGRWSRAATKWLLSIRASLTRTKFIQTSFTPHQLPAHAWIKARRLGRPDEGDLPSDGRQTLRPAAPATMEMPIASRTGSKTQGSRMRLALKRAARIRPPTTLPGNVPVRGRGPRLAASANQARHPATQPPTHTYTHTHTHTHTPYRETSGVESQSCGDRQAPEAAGPWTGDFLVWAHSFFCRRIAMLLPPAVLVILPE
ncbi:hypothetical protein CDD83_10006 [Cordyceps sp. RAO-2017]|nr:hypothetical protein CDD83_10006 [Cordyceps sp. RAO-2017]